MKVLAIIALAVLSFWLLTIGLGVLSIAGAAAIWWLIKTDKANNAQDEFFAICFGLGIVGVILGLAGF